MQERIRSVGKLVLTSGYPLGSKKASGMPQLGGNPGTRGARSEGGVGAAVYSVKARPLRLGEVGVVTPLVGSSDMMERSRSTRPLSEARTSTSTKAQTIAGRNSFAL